MFDNISFEIHNYSQSDFETLVAKISCEVVVQRAAKFIVNWHNLRINYYPNVHIIKVTNSLHKFYNAEIAKLGAVNYNDFTRSQLIETVSYLEDMFDRKATEMKILGRFEYGLNIHTYDVKPFIIIDRYQSIVTTAKNPFYAQPNPYGKPYGKYCSFTEYTVKFYDKGKEGGVPTKNILRYEIVHHSILKSRAVLGKHQLTMADLIDEENWKKLFKMLEHTYDRIRMLPFKTDDIGEYTKILFYSSPTVSNDYKDAFKPIAQELENAHSRMIYDNSNPHSYLKENITKKMNYLLNN